MPFTPLHLGAALPVKVFAKEKFSIGAFIVVQLLIDIEPAMIWAYNWPYPMHGEWHGFNWSLLMALIVALLYPGKFRATAAGGFWGAVSHIVLDSNMHAELVAFRPWLDTNPFYGLVPIWLVDSTLLALSIVSLAVLYVRRKQANGVPRI